MEHLRHLHTFVALHQGKNALRQWNTCGIYQLSLDSVNGATHSVSGAPAEFTHFRCTPSGEECTPSTQHLRYLHTFVALRQGKNALRQCNTSGIYALLLHSVRGRTHSANATPPVFTYFCCTPSREECTPSVEHLQNLHTLDTPSMEQCTPSVEELRHLPTFVTLRQLSNALRQCNACKIYTLSSR